VHLNGREVFRSPNLPAWPTVITASTWTTGANGENTVDQATVGATNLVTGTNLVAVEIHQSDADSSDVSFDFGMDGIPRPPAALSAELYFAEMSGQLVLGWSASGYVLDEADVVTGPWGLAANTSPFLLTPAVGQKFYRLRRL